MPVCRICLTQSYKDVHDLYFGEPTVRHKLITCVPLLDNKLLDTNYRICENCFNDLNTSYELHAKLMAAQIEIKSIMPPNDYENLDKYAFEASMRRQNVLLHEEIDLDDSMLCDIKVDEQLAAIANIEPMDSATMEPPLPPPKSTPGNIPMVFALPSGSVPTRSVPVRIPLQGPFGVNKSLDDASGSNTSTNVDRLMRFVEGRMCHVCYRQYPNKTCLQSHIKSVHQSNGNSNIMKRKVVNNLLSSLSAHELSAINMEVAKKCVETECERCQITFRCMHELQYHITAIHKEYPINNVHFNVKCSICNVVFSHKYLKLHLRGHELKVKLTDIFKKNRIQKTGPYVVLPFSQCQICKVLYKNTKQSMEEHQKMHQQNQSKIMS